MKALSFLSRVLVLMLAAAPAIAWWGMPGCPLWSPDHAGRGPGAPADSVRLERQATKDAYRLLIHLKGYQPSEIAVSVVGNALVVRSVRAEGLNRVEQGGYQFVRRTHRFERRMSLPRDADVAAMRRTDKEGLVEIQIPRRR
jgi:HSP20 family molecular chaperone IbpA